MWSLLSLAVLLPAARGDLYSRQSSGSNVSRPDGKISAGWYAGYHSEQLPLKKVSWDKYTNIIFAFAYVAPLASFAGFVLTLCHVTSTPSNDVEELQISEPDQQLLPEFVSLAHENVSEY
jgi:hypothetical protein